MKIPEELEFDWKAAVFDIETAIRWHFQNTGTEKAVVGISGGVDSAVAATLVARAIGRENLLGVLMPESGVTPGEDMEDALKVVKFLKIKHKVIEINPISLGFAKPIPEILNNKITYANVKARTRMIILYAYANLMGRAQVVGTGDKSELLLGYTTKYGDHGVDFFVIADLYKTQVRWLSDKLGLPDRIWQKKPSPQLVKGQGAEDEIGVSYADIDKVLYYYVDQGYPPEEIAALGVNRKIVDRLIRMVAIARHKRKSPPIAKVGSATINWDWRMPME